MDLKKDEPKAEAKEKNKNEKEDKVSDEKLKGVIERASKMSVDFINLPNRIIKDLREAGYENVGDIIEEGPENLAEKLVIEPSEVVLVAKAIEKIVKDSEKNFFIKTLCSDE